MPVGGTGMGDDVGNLNQPSIFELETQGAVEISKARLGIVQDTLEISFTQLGKNDLWQYKASSNRPTLAPLISTRMETGHVDESDLTWKGIQDEILKKLPADVQVRYARDNEKPLAERSTAFIALGEAIKMLAKLLSQFGRLETIETLSTRAERRAEFNALLPTIAHEESLSLGAFVNSRAFNFLEMMGSNTPYFDKFSGTIRQFDHALHTYQESK